MEKTATKTLDELINEFNSKPYGVSLEKFIYDYFYIHRSAQQLSEYKEVIKELLPLAALSKITVDDPNWCELWENKTKVIDRAKKLI